MVALTRTAAVTSGAALLLVMAGCGSSSVESTVQHRYGGEVRSCRAVGLVDEGKIYSCQTDRSTLCVIVDGKDVFNATARAQAIGVAC